MHGLENAGSTGRRKVSQFKLMLFLDRKVCQSLAAITVSLDFD